MYGYIKVSRTISQKMVGRRLQGNHRCLTRISAPLIYIAAVKAGAAAEHVEARKDDHHEARVMAVEEEFYPLVVETYGYWTPASLQILMLICSRVSAVTSYSFSQTQKP